MRFVFRPAADLPPHEAAVLRILAQRRTARDRVWQLVRAAGHARRRSTPLGELFLPLEGLVDVAAERERLAKEIAKVESELAKVRAKLGDANFAAKVPAAVLDEHRQRETAWAEKLAQLAKMRAALQE